MKFILWYTVYWGFVFLYDLTRMYYDYDGYKLSLKDSSTFMSFVIWFIVFIVLYNKFIK